MRKLFIQLEAIANASGSNEKKKLLGELCKDANHKEILRMALDPLHPMYLGREAKFTPVAGEYAEEFDSKAIIKTMTNLNSGLIGRGSIAIKTISEIIGSFEKPKDSEMEYYLDKLTWQELAMRWIPRLVTKDLQIGISWESFTKVNGEKKFAVMLAKDIKKIKNLEKKFVFPVYVQPKLDGYRAFSNAEGEHELRSRNGKLYKNFPTIVEALKEVCPDYVLLDGEIMSDDFQAMQKTAFRQDGETVGDVKFHVFDIVAREEWNNREGTHPFADRMDALAQLIGHHPLISIVSTQTCYSWEEVYEIHEMYIKQGFEGTMVRANVPYQFKRTDSLAKIKEMLSMDCEVLSMEEGRNSLVGCMGKLNVKQENGVECGVGSGFTQGDRTIMWKHQDLTIGRIAEIKYQELTKDGVMRFPVFMRFRDDKDEKM